LLLGFSKILLKGPIWHAHFYFLTYTICLFFSNHPLYGIWNLMFFDCTQTIRQKLDLPCVRRPEKEKRMQAGNGSGLECGILGFRVEYKNGDCHEDKKA